MGFTGNTNRNFFEQSGGRGEGGGRWHKRSSFCDTLAKKLQNLLPKIIWRLRHHQDSQVAIYIHSKLWTSKVINQNAYFGKKRSIKEKVN